MVNIKVGRKKLVAGKEPFVLCFDSVDEVEKLYNFIGDTDMNVMKFNLNELDINGLVKFRNEKVLIKGQKTTLVFEDQEDGQLIIDSLFSLLNIESNNEYEQKKIAFYHSDKATSEEIREYMEYGKKIEI